MSDLMNMFRVFFPSSSFRGSGLIAAFAFLICLFAAQSAQAQLTLTVTRTDDRNATCASGVDCSLREAVNAANTAPTNDTINFAISAGDAGCTSRVCTITLTLSELANTSAATAGTLTITNSTGASNLLISGNNTSRVFFLNTGANLTISGVTITKGNGTGTTNSGFNGNGGGITNVNGTLALTNSIVSGNTVAASGGGIYNQDGTTTLTNSTVSGNTGTYGGGILNNQGTLNLTGSTVSGNMASYYGGGIYNSGTSTLTNSTVSGNTASYFGGGIFNNSFKLAPLPTILNLTSVTVTKNSSTSTNCTTCAGGIGNVSGTATLQNTIVAGNTSANAASSPDFSGAVAATSSFNLIGNGLVTTGISNADANNNQVGSSASPIDPKLGALANNGGATQTHALLFGSPALDKGNSFGLTTDQRGFARPVNLDDTTYPNAADGSDIGAFELGVAARRKKVLLSPVQ